jgi:hypothetical protein
MELLDELIDRKFLPDAVNQVDGEVRTLPKARWLDFVRRVENPLCSERYFYACVRRGSSLHWFGELLRVGSTIRGHDISRQDDVAFDMAEFSSLQPVDCFYANSGVLHGGDLFLPRVGDITWEVFLWFFIRESKLMMKPEEIEWFQAIGAHKGEECIRLAAKRDLNQVVNFPIPELTPAGIRYYMWDVSAFTYSIVAENLDFAEWAIANGANIDAAVGRENEQPLHNAVRQSNRQFLRVFLAHCKDPGKVNTQGSTPLYIAVGGGDFEKVRMLLLAGADPNAGGFSPYFKLSKYPVLSLMTLPVVRLLKQYGADFGITCRASGVSPLHFNCQAESRDVFVELVRYGLDPHQKNNDGITPLERLKKYAGEKIFAEVCSTLGLKNEPPKED